MLLLLFFCSPLSVFYLFGQTNGDSLVISPSALDFIYNYEQLDQKQVYVLCLFFVIFILILLYSYKHEKSRGILIFLATMSMLVGILLGILSLTFWSLIFSCLAIIYSFFFLRCSVYRLSIKFDLIVYVIAITLAFIASLVERI